MATSSASSTSSRDRLDSTSRRMPICEIRVLRRKSTLIAEVLTIDRHVMSAIQRQGLLRDAEARRVMSETNNLLRVVKFLELLENTGPATFEKLTFLIENLGYSWLSDELIVELVCEKGHLEIDPSVMSEARAIVRQRMGTRRKLEKDDFNELTMLIATRYQVAKETYNRQEMRLATFKARDKRQVKDNLRELCQEIEEAMANAPSPVLAASAELETDRDSKPEKHDKKKKIFAPPPKEHLTAQEIANLASGNSAADTANWMGLLKNRISNLTTAYTTASSILDKKTKDEAARKKAEMIAKQEAEKEAAKKRFKLPSDSSIGDNVNMSEIEKLAVELNARQKMEEAKNKRVLDVSRKNSNASLKPPSLRKTISNSKRHGVTETESIVSGHMHVSSHSSVENNTKNKSTTNNKGNKSAHTTHSKNDSAHRPHSKKDSAQSTHFKMDSTHIHQESIPKHKDTIGHLPSHTHAKYETTFGSIAERKRSQNFHPSDFDRFKATSKLGRRESRQSWSRAKSRNKNPHAKEPVSKYKDIAIEDEDKQVVLNQIRKDAIRVKRINKTLENMRKSIGPFGPMTGFKKMESQYWKARCDVMKKSKSVGYYYFLSEHRRRKCDACHDTPVRDVPVTESKTTVPVSKYCKELSFLHYQEPSRIVPEYRKQSTKNKQVSPHDLMQERYFLPGEEHRSEFPQEFDDESCPGATSLPDGRKRCIACASANKDLPNLFDGLLAPHAEHHLYVPPLVSRVVPMRVRKTELERVVTQPQIPQLAVS